MSLNSLLLVVVALGIIWIINNVGNRICNEIVNLGEKFKDRINIIELDLRDIKSSLNSIDDEAHEIKASCEMAVEKVKEIELKLCKFEALK